MVLKKRTLLGQLLLSLSSAFLLSLATVSSHASTPPTVSVSGGDRTVSDSDGVSGETVTLSASASDSDGSISEIQWFDGSTDIGTGSSISVRLSDGSHSISVIAIDDAGDSSEGWATITVLAPAANTAPSVSIDGGNRAVRDADGVAGETVSMTATASDSDGTIATIRWYLSGSLVGTGTTADIALNDGENVVTVTVTDDDGAGASTSATITVRAVGVVNQKPVISNVNYSAEIADSDLKAGETTDLSITATDSDGSIASIAWRVNDSTTLTGSSVSAALTDGSNTVVVTVTDNEGATASQTLAITVTKPANRLPMFSGYDPRSLVPDSDLMPGETISLSAGAADVDGVITSIEISVDGSVTSAYSSSINQNYGGIKGFTFIKVSGLRLSDGVHTLSLTLIDNEGGTVTETNTITVQGRVIEPTVRDVIGGGSGSLQINLDFVNADKQAVSSFRSGEEIYAMLDVVLPEIILQHEVHAYLYLASLDSGAGFAITGSGGIRPEPVVNGTRLPAAIYSSEAQPETNFSVSTRLDYDLAPGSYVIIGAVSIDRSTSPAIYTTSSIEFTVLAAETPKPLFQRLASVSSTGGDDVFESRVMNQHGESKSEYIYGEDIINVNIFMYPAKKYIEDAAFLASDVEIYKLLNFNGNLFAHRAAGGWMPTSLNPLVATEKRALQYIEKWDISFDTVNTVVNPPGNYTLYMGYKAEGQIFYNSDPVSFTIVEKAE